MSPEKLFKELRLFLLKWELEEGSKVALKYSLRASHGSDIISRYLRSWICAGRYLKEQFFWSLKFQGI